MPKNEHGGEKVVKKPTTGGNYALFQLSKAITTGTQHPDPETRQRAQLRAKKWASVFNQIVNGNLAVGSRTPLGGVPAWVTLKVLTGGFATGELLADGPLEAHEQLLREKFPLVAEDDVRRALNTYYLTDVGLAELQNLLATGAYDISLPEEGALLVVAWLAQNSQQESAQQLLETLGPWFSRLRFYPIPAQAMHESGSRIFLQNVGETIQILEHIKPDPQILTQQETVCIWTPLYDQLVQLFLETVEGEIPSLQCDADGKWMRSPSGKFPVKGGWPCRNYPADWSDRAIALLNECETARATHKLSQRPERDGENFTALKAYLIRCVDDSTSLQGRDVGRIRQILACYVTKRGTPNSPQCQTVRAREYQHASAPTHQEIAGVLISRLQTFPRETGLGDPTIVTHVISAVEATRYSIPVGTLVPEPLQRKVERCLHETVDILVECGLITSGDTLARVLPQITADIRATGFEDPALRHLFAAVYSAFRRRRSLLLLNLEHQIRVEELPWVGTLDSFRQSDLAGRELARQTLEEVSLVTITAFPHAILPNKLLQELGALAKTAELELPFVEEVAADIFRGRFSDKFLAAAHQAAAFLDKSLYATYYGIDYQEVRGILIKAPRKSDLFKKPSASEHDFAELCARRAGVPLGGWKPAVNGMVIEQEQILTTQNLSVLFKEFHLANILGEQVLNEFAQRCFQWICQRLQGKGDNWHAQLIQVKNAAYAWRQMLFFLSLLPLPNQTNFLRWAEERMMEQPPIFQDRFRPALLGLSFAIDGLSLESQEAVQAGAKQFLGWSETKHWLMIDLE